MCKVDLNIYRKYYWGFCNRVARDLTDVDNSYSKWTISTYLQGTMLGTTDVQDKYGKGEVVTVSVSTGTLNTGKKWIIFLGDCFNFCKEEFGYNEQFRYIEEYLRLKGFEKN